MIHRQAEVKDCALGRYTEVGARTSLTEVVLGDYSYIGNDGDAIYTRIGKFCSIAANTRVNALEHPIERVTAHKLTYRPNEYFRYLGVDKEFRARRQAKRVTIGHDVWIGHGAVIMPGVSIGNGAVVGANAVVTRDVAPYQIAAGVPSRGLRMRFAPDIVERLQRMAWWDWPVERLFDAIPDMQRLATGEFLDRWEGKSPIA